MSVERARLVRGRLHVEDRAVTPQAEWLVEDFDLDAGSLTTRTGDVPGRLDVSARINEARVALHAEPVRLNPFGLRRACRSKGSRRAAWTRTSTRRSARPIAQPGGGWAWS